MQSDEEYDGEDKDEEENEPEDEEDAHALLDVDDAGDSDPWRGCGLRPVVAGNVRGGPRRAVGLAARGNRHWLPCVYRSVEPLVLGAHLDTGEPFWSHIGDVDWSELILHAADGAWRRIPR